MHRTDFFAPLLVFINIYFVEVMQTIKAKKHTKAPQHVDDDVRGKNIFLCKTIKKRIAIFLEPSAYYVLQLTQIKYLNFK
jgi:hypothetical protein